MNTRFTALLLALLTLGLPARGQAADPWHLAGWQARAIVEIPTPSMEKGVDTAGVRILCQGRAKADGSDYRVLDANGKPTPFQVHFHDHERYTLLSFRADNPKQRFFVYFGNPQAARAPEEIQINPVPGSGPPTAAWVPKYGLVLQTMERPEVGKQVKPDQRPENDNPRTPEEMAKLMAGSKRKHGARFQRRIADGYNSFGPSDYYISVYRGWMNIPAAGKYAFCTASNEASFSFLDGKTLVHWPGRHTAERGMYGEVNAEVELTAGLHYIEYYHEEVTLEQMAYLGWKPPGERGFIPIPESLYTAPHSALVRGYEDPKGPLLQFEPIITDSVWPASRSEGQYTRCRIKLDSPAAGATYRWDFGDGQTAAGAEVEHVYLTLGNFVITLQAQGPAGMQTARWPLQVFEIEHVTETFREGRPPDYAKLAKTYDRAKLDGPALKELASLFAESEQPADALEVGKAFVQRFPTAKPLEMARVRRLMADCALQLGQGSVDEAISNYKAALVKEMPAAEKIDALARLIRLEGVEHKKPEEALKLLKDVEEAVKSSKADEDDVQPAYRRAVIAMADVRLWLGNPEGARDLYGKAERLSGKFIPPQVRAARVGSYPNSIREYLATGNYGAALDVVDQWDETFPTEKPNGHTFFYRGRILALRGQPGEAKRFLERAILLTVGASFETEARFVYAECLEKLNRKDDARKELARLVATGLNDDFTKQAKKKLLEK
jgi:tetratricopeptide (TPR) repeat protein